jgi:hypothetical protein
MLAGEGEMIEWSEDATYPYTLDMANEDSVLEEAMDNLKEAGQRIRLTQGLTLAEETHSSRLGATQTLS